MRQYRELFSMLKRLCNLSWDVVLQIYRDRLYDLALRVLFEHVPDKAAADKTAASGDENAHQMISSLSMSQSRGW